MRVIAKIISTVVLMLFAASAGAGVKQYGGAGSAWGIVTCPSGYVVAGPSGGAPGAPSCVPIDYTYLGVVPDTNVSSNNYPGQSYLSGIINDLYTYKGVPTPSTSVCIDNSAPPAWKFYLCNPVVVNDNATSAPTPPSGTVEQIVAADSTASYRVFDTFGAAGEYVTRRADGTNQTPTALASGNEVFCGFEGRGWDGAAWSSGDQAGIRCLTSQTWTSTHHGAAVAVYTTTNNTTTQHQAALFNASGGLQMNDSSGNAPTGGDPGAGGINAIVLQRNGNNAVTVDQTNGGLTISGAVSVVKSFLARQRVPLIMQSSGSVGNNGALSGITALDTTFGNAYEYFIANSICTVGTGGNSAGWYYVQMSSTTAGTIYNNVYTSGVPSIPGSPTAFSCTGPGAYTQTTSEIQGLTYTIPANAMGTSGILKTASLGGYPNNANTKTLRYYYGGVQFGTYQDTTHTQSQPVHVIREIGSTALQISGNFVLDQQAVGSLFKRTVDTTSSQTYYISIQLANAADFYEFLGADTDIEQ